MVLDLASHYGIVFFETPPRNHLLRLGPELTTPTCLLDLGPLLNLLPSGDEEDTPQHDHQRINEIEGAVVGGVVVIGIKPNRQQAYDHGEDQPFLQECHEIEVAVDVRPH